MFHTVSSKNSVLIRLTNERWEHIIENHDDLTEKTSEVLNTVAQPDIILQGTQNELLAVKKIQEKWLIVVYKEITEKDGFIITAFITSRIQYLLHKKILWKKQ